MKPACKLSMKTYNLQALEVLKNLKKTFFFGKAACEIEMGTTSWCECKK